MKKILPIFFTLLLFLFITLLWLQAEDDNKALLSRMDWYMKIKTPAQCEQVIKETCRIYEPEIIYKKIVERNECPVCESVEEWKLQADMWNEKNLDLLNQVKYLKDKCINF